ncbi:unnamed protein product [Linum tenue]|uniref:WRKY domain-containing protein n=1 Tax=Linum tenue TaxID=586396 RepID=A0AAV0PHZ5_9ROSI|nr:unnamed protein product [Linum tenue]
MADDWDLLAVVRGCSAASSSAIPTCCNTTTTSSSSSASSSFQLDFHSQSPSPSSSFTPYGLEQVSRFFCSSPSSVAAASPVDLARRDLIGDKLDELYKPFFPRSHHSLSLPPPPPPPTTNASASLISPPFPADQTNPAPPPFLLRNQPPLKRPLPSSASAPSSSRSKRRKNQVKKVCQVPAEALSADVWAWRKYGQKPIKGSPYPRGYYRCSTSKACMARKQVERNRSDPGMFIVTYTAEHSHPAPSHRNSLAGTTRHKTSPADESEKPCSDVKPTSSSPTTPAEDDDQQQQLLLQGTAAAESKEVDLEMIEDEEDNDESGNCGGFSPDAPDDDFFVGLEELTSLAAGDCFSVPFPTGFGFPRLATAGSF